MNVVLFSLIKFAIIVFGFVMVLATLLTLIERKQSALTQNRTGPNRAFLLGIKHPIMAFIGQLIAEPVKILFKEDVVPAKANHILHRIAPALAFIPALMMWLVIPFGPGPKPGVDGPHYFQITDLNGGVLVIFAVASLSVYGAVIGAWASNSGYSMLGGLRTAAQMVSYEVTLALNLVGIFMIFGSISINEIVWGQTEYLLGFIPKWGIVVQPVAFILFLTASIAETKRAPFDLPEAESELVAGYFTEYSSMRFALFSLGEFVAIIAVAAIGATLFFGGWQIPWVEMPTTAEGLPILGHWLTWVGVGVFILKTLALVWLQMQIRWTLPRFRYDQLMKLGWIYLLPLSLANVAVTAVFMYFLR
ncbi:MAG: complex I subunit 1/NuoH family protein [Myxococcota bacterium]